MTYKKNGRRLEPGHPGRMPYRALYGLLRTEQQRHGGHRQTRFVFDLSNRLGAEHPRPTAAVKLAVAEKHISLPRFYKNRDSRSSISTSRICSPVTPLSANMAPAMSRLTNRAPAVSTRLIMATFLPPTLPLQKYLRK